MLRTLDALNHDPRLPALGDNYYSVVPPTPVSAPHLVAFNPAAAALIDLDPAEESTGTAVSWLDNGACPSARKSLAKALFPRTERPTLVEDNQPGLF